MSDSTWPPVNGLCTPTVSRENAILTSVASIHVSAPASVVFDVLCATDRYPDWNGFCPKVTILSQPDGAPTGSAVLVKNTSFIFHVVMDSNKPNKETPTQLVVTDVSTPEKPSDYIPNETLKSDPSYTEDLATVYRISWKSEGGFVKLGLKSERFHEIIIKGDNACEVRTWEVMGGVVARTVKWLYEKVLAAKFQEWCEDLKKASEAQVVAPTA